MALADTKRHETGSAAKLRRLMKPWARTPPYVYRGVPSKSYTCTLNQLQLTQVLAIP